MAVIFPEDTKAARAARKFCLDCQGASPSLVRECAEEECPLHPWRLSDSPCFFEEYGKVIRAVCRNCLLCAGDRREVRSCDTEESCPLWGYRFGVHPVTYKRVSIRVRAPKTLFLPGFAPKK
jgi:hypothetical protein